jgi:hypothetical protein
VATEEIFMINDKELTEDVSFTRLITRIEADESANTQMQADDEDDKANVAMRDVATEEIFMINDKELVTKVKNMYEHSVFSAPAVINLPPNINRADKIIPSNTSLIWFLLFDRSFILPVLLKYTR